MIVIVMMIIYYYLDYLVQYDVDGIGCNDFFSYDQHLSIHICIISIYLLYIHIYTHLFIMYICRDGSTFIIALSYSLHRYLSVK